VIAIEKIGGRACALGNPGGGGKIEQLGISALYIRPRHSGAQRLLIGSNLRKSVPTMRGAVYDGRILGMVFAVVNLCWKPLSGRKASPFRNEVVGLF